MVGGVYLRWLGGKALAARRDLLELDPQEGVPIYLHRALETFFLAHPLKLKAAGIGRWHWLALDSDVDIGLEILQLGSAASSTGRLIKKEGGTHG
jgi:hypothetical protein